MYEHNCTHEGNRHNQLKNMRNHKQHFYLSRVTDRSDGLKKLAVTKPSMAFKCPLCPKQFMHQQNCTSHMLSHDTLRSGEIQRETNTDQEKNNNSQSDRNQARMLYRCGICKRDYKNETSLRSHIYIYHKKGKTFYCYKCDTQFSKISEFLSHMFFHMGTMKHLMQ